MIEEYRFGAITIDGKTYNNDVEVHWNEEVSPWQQKERHIIGLEDIARALGQDPEVIVIGTGEQGQASVTEELKEAINQKGVELIVDITEQATKTFNVIKEESVEEEGRQAKVVGLFHITC